MHAGFSSEEWPKCEGRSRNAGLIKKRRLFDVDRVTSGRNGILTITMHFGRLIINYVSVFFFALADRARPLEFSREKMDIYREKVKTMFYHAYNGYLNHAYPLDELKPITCTGMDTWGSFSLTLIDALDTLVVLGNYTEFQRAANLVLDRIDFDADVNVSVFETNIRVIGGLLSAHMLSKMGGLPLEDGWPCSGPLLSLAERVANKLMPAFNTLTGMPYGTVNLRHGVHKFETPITCTAGVGTFILEFATLSRLTGSPHLERVAMKAMMELWKQKSSIGLVGNHINVQTGAWTATDAGIGAGVDSYFEYLVKGAIMFNKPELMRQFKEYQQAINTHIKQDDWFVWVTMTKGQVTLPVFQSLEAFWPGLLTLVGDVDGAMRIMMNYYQVLKQFGFTPEFYNIPTAEAVHKRSGYPLRPELAESLMYLYRATQDPLLLQIGAELVEAIEHSAKTSCGYATVHDVKNHVIEDRMESFFLSETTKYLYLLFDPDNFVHNPGSSGQIVSTPNGQCVVNSGGYVFNTEAHILDPSAVYCCGDRRQKDVQILAQFEDNLNLLSLFGLDDDHDTDLDMQFFKDDSDEALKHAHDLLKNGRNENPNLDVEYEVNWDGQRKKIGQDTTSTSVGVDATLDRKKSKITTDPGSTDPEVLKRLNQLSEKWSEALKLASDLASVKRASKNDCEDQGVCRIMDMDTGYPAFNAALKYIYGGNSMEDIDSCQSIDQPEAKILDQADEDYFDTHPDYESLSNVDAGDDEKESQATVAKIDPMRFNYSELINWQNTLMSCPVLPFAFRISALGEVIPAR